MFATRSSVSGRVVMLVDVRRSFVPFAMVAVGCAATVGAAAATTPAHLPFAGPGRSADARAAQVLYAPPLGPLVVVRRFDPPTTPYGPGHLGVDLRGAAGIPVRAAAVGTVRFAGSVAGRGVVVVLHPDGISTEYEPLQPLVRVGARVQRGQLLGRLTGRHRGCSGWCLHWGAKRGAAYLDPLSLLRPLGPVRLLPWPRDG